jgi:TRAP-type C4-dicarboxylate transport system substrate-binding protein
MGHRGVCRFEGLARSLKAGLVALTLGLMATSGALSQVDPAAAAAPQVLRIVGGLGNLNQYTRHEEPFWTQRLAELSGGRFKAEVVPFDRAGIRSTEMLTLVRLGTVPFGTQLLSTAAPRDAELSAPDLAGLSSDAAAQRRAVTAFRGRLAELLRQRHDAELLAVYSYPAQMLFCRRPLRALAELRGLRVRTSSPTQSDFVEALGGVPVTVPFAQLTAEMKAGNLDCAITGTMSGNTIGLHELTTHLFAMPINWGLSAFVAHRPTWLALPAALRELLQRELPRLEDAIWAEAALETASGLACNTGRPECRGGRAGTMTLVTPSAADEALRRQLLAGTVLPRWLQRCGEGCRASWNSTLGPVAGAAAR